MQGMGGTLFLASIRRLDLFQLWWGELYLIYLGQAISQECSTPFYIICIGSQNLRVGVFWIFKFPVGEPFKPCRLVMDVNILVLFGQDPSKVISEHSLRSRKLCRERVDSVNRVQSTSRNISHSTAFQGHLCLKLLNSVISTITDTSSETIIYHIFNYNGTCVRLCITFKHIKIDIKLGFTKKCFPRAMGSKFKLGIGNFNLEWILHSKITIPIYSEI